VHSKRLYIIIIIIIKYRCRILTFIAIDHITFLSSTCTFYYIFFVAVYMYTYTCVRLIYLILIFKLCSWISRQGFGSRITPGLYLETALKVEPVRIVVIWHTLCMCQWSSWVPPSKLVKSFGLRGRSNSNYGVSKPSVSFYYSLVKNILHSSTIFTENVLLVD
jgi:hypothetical protein